MEAWRWILLALEPEPSHGYAIIKRVEELSSGTCRLATGSFYPLLEKLLRDRLVERTDRVDEDAPYRAYYQLTEKARLRFFGVMTQ